MLNKVVLIGRLVREIELRETNSGVPYTYATLAVDRPGQNGQTDFIDCVAWRGTAEILKKYTNKGSLIAVEGRIEVYSTESNGNYDKRVNVNVQTVTLLDSRKTGVANATTPEPTAPANTAPVQETKTEEVKEESKTGDFDLSFDDIKF